MEERKIYWASDSPQLWSQFLAAIYRILTSFGEVVEIILALTPYWEKKELPVISCTGIRNDSTAFCLAVLFCKALGLKIHFFCLTKNEKIVYLL